MSLFSLNLTITTVPLFNLNWKNLILNIVDENTNDILLLTADTLKVSCTSSMKHIGYKVKTSQIKKVRFEDKCRVILVPCVRDYIDAGLQSAIWYSSSEMHENRMDIQQKVESFLKESKENCDINKVLSEILEMELKE